VDGDGGEIRFSIELDEDREREMYGLGGGLESSTTGDLIAGIFSE